MLGGKKKSELVSLIEAEIFLSGFGEHSSIPKTLVPPEVYFLPQELTSFSSDIWSLACTIWASDYITSATFEGIYPEIRTKLFVQRIEILGDLPPEWWQQWDNRLEWFNEEG